MLHLVPHFKNMFLLTMWNCKNQNARTVVHNFMLKFISRYTEKSFVMLKISDISNVDYTKRVLRNERIEEMLFIGLEIQEE